MGKILSLKTWEPASCEVRGIELSYEVKRPNPEETKLVVRPTERMFRAVTEFEKAESVGEKASSAVGIVESIPAEAKEIFSRFIRNVKGLEVDGEAKTTGADLYEVADSQVVLTVLTQLSTLARLTVTEGKGSGSRSGSSVGADEAPTSSDSAAPSTAAGDGPGPSDATASPVLDPDFVTAGV